MMMESLVNEEKLKDVSTILFDLDNTLIETKKADQLACEKVCRHLIEAGIQCSTAEDCVRRFYELIRLTPQDPNYGGIDVDTWRIGLWRRALGEDLDLHAETAYQIWKEDRMTYIKLTAKVKSMLKELHKGYKLCLITNGPSEAQWEKVHQVNASKYFDLVLVGGDHKKEKPSRYIFEKAFKYLDVSPSYCVMVGDNLQTDIMGGLNAGVAATFWISRDARKHLVDDVHPKPDFILKNVYDILDMLHLN